MKLEVKRLGVNWWVIGLDDFGPIGPYDTCSEAEEERRGISRFLQHENEPGFVTCERRFQ